MSMTTATPGYNSKEKWNSSMRGSGLGAFVRSEIRLIVAFQAGAVAAFMVLLVVFMPINYLWSSPDGASSIWSLGASASSPFFRRGQFPQEWDAAQGIDNDDYVREWELPQVREIQADDSMAEAAYGEFPRRFIPFGTGNFLFSLFGTYRTGPKSFAVVGLGPRLLHKFWSKPLFECYWDSNDDTSSASSLEVHPSRNTRLPRGDDNVIQGTAINHYPQDLDFTTSADYTTVVVHCTFESPVGADGKGGALKMTADHGERKKQSPEGPLTVDFVALTEAKGAHNATSFESPFQYEYLYCGAPLYGSVNPRRLREWIAYHMRLFGERSHFFFYDEGGVNDESAKVLEPWVKLGRLTIMNVRQGARYETYYHSQFLYTNDCLFRAKSLARWAFFFDIDEYLFVTTAPHLELSFHTVMSEMAEMGRKATIVQFNQRIMSHSLCVRNDSAPTLHQRQWMTEKLVYRRQLKDEEQYEFSGVWTPLDDFKSAVQPKYVLLMGVHEPVEVELPEGLVAKRDTCAKPNTLLEDKGCTWNSTGDKLVYYHFHGTTSKNEEVCREFVDSELIDKTVDFGGSPYKIDNSLNALVDSVKNYELEAIGAYSNQQQFDAPPPKLDVDSSQP